MAASPGKYATQCRRAPLARQDVRSHSIYCTMELQALLACSGSESVRSGAGGGQQMVQAGLRWALNEHRLINTGNEKTSQDK